jgi:CheY-like chemotaxis protein
MGLVVALVDDLLFLSRIREVAGAASVRVVSARNAAALLEACRAEPPTLVLADLDSPRLDGVGAIRGLRADPAGAGLRIVGFFSHVESERGREASAAGASLVLPRGAFARQLPGLIGAAKDAPG